MHDCGSIMREEFCAFPDVEGQATECSCTCWYLHDVNIEPSLIILMCCAVLMLLLLLLFSNLLPERLYAAASTCY